MGVIHGLEGDAGVIAVKVAVLDEVLDGIDDLKIESVNGECLDVVMSVPSSGGLLVQVWPLALRAISMGDARAMWNVSYYLRCVYEVRRGK